MINDIYTLSDDTENIITLTDDRIALLHKTIALQSTLIQGNSLADVFEDEISMFHKFSGAETIVVCLNNNSDINIQFILEENKQFLYLLKKYKLSSKHMFLNKFMRYAHFHFQEEREYMEIDSLHDFFDGTFTKSDAAEFEKDMNYQTAYIFPFRNFSRKKIGFILYIYTGSMEANIKKQSQLTKLIETIIQPFYNEEQQTLHTKCVPVDDNMGILTEREKAITIQVLHGMPYKEISSELGISINTVKTHMKNIFSKYGVCSKMELQNKLIGSF